MPRIAIKHYDAFLFWRQEPAALFQHPVNRVNLGNPTTGNAQTTVTLDLANPAFGKSTSAFTPRVYQLGLKIQF